MSDDSGLALERELMLMMKAHRRFMHGSLELHGLYPGQPEVLHAIAMNEGASQGEIASSSCVRAATVTVMLRRLEQVGMIARRPDGGDKRVVRVYLTPKGRETVGRMRGLFQEGSQRVYSVLTRDEQAEMIRLVKKIRARIDELQRERNKEGDNH